VLIICVSKGLGAWGVELWVVGPIVIAGGVCNGKNIHVCLGWIGIGRGECGWPWLSGAMTSVGLVGCMTHINSKGGMNMQHWLFLSIWKTLELSFNSLWLLVGSWLFCLQNFSCLVSFWCMRGGSVEVWTKKILYRFMKGQTHQEVLKWDSELETWLEIEVCILSAYTTNI
jgi:hypothetical protein